MFPFLPPRTPPEGSIVVQGVVLRERSERVTEVLLVHRHSPRAWELPGGMPEVGESIRDAVIREVLEETGLRVEPIRQVATFRRTGFRPHISPVFRCEVIGGTPTPNLESVAVGFHAVDRLPWGTFPWLRATIGLVVEDLRLGSSSASGTEREICQHLGWIAVAHSLLIHTSGVARLRS